MRKRKQDRKSHRLAGYNYAGNGWYYITICIQNPRLELFGNIVNGTMVLNDIGKCVNRCWFGIPDHYPFVVLDEFMVMPNHVHGIFAINKRGYAGANDYSPLRNRDGVIAGTSRSVGAVVRGFKIGVTKWCRERVPGADIWQRDYHDRIIRNDDALNRIRAYIRYNDRIWWERRYGAG